MSARKLTVIGLDAATFDVVDPLVAAGELPNLGRLLENGARGVLRSTVHPLTPLAWTTMLTGVNAGRHGIWDFSERDETGYRVRPINGSYRRAPAVWDHLTRAGRTAGIVNVPFTWPAPAVDGFAIAGLDASEREEGMTHPRELVRELQATHGPLVLDHTFPIGADGRADLALARRAVEQKLAIVHELAARHDPDLLLVVFMAADHIQHICWPEWEEAGAASTVAEVYRILDEAVGELLARTPDDRDVVVVSDHGAGRLDGVVNLNAWLRAEGYLAYAGGGEHGRRLVRAGFEWRRKLPPGLRYAVKQRVPRLRDRIYELREYSLVDWRATRAFSYGTFGNLVVNLRGRESQGIVEPGAEYEQVRDELIERALGLRGKDGEPIVAAVHRREDLYDGPELERLPDLIVEFDRYAYLGKGTLTSRAEGLWDEIPVAPGSAHGYVGSHRPEGVFVLAGPSAQRTDAVAANAIDLAPTLLYLLGADVPDDLEGRVLLEAIRPEVLDERPPVYASAGEVELPEAQEAYDDEDADAVTERLRALGYLE